MTTIPRITMCLLVSGYEVNCMEKLASVVLEISSFFSVVFLTCISNMHFLACFSKGFKNVTSLHLYNDYFIYY